MREQLGNKVSDHYFKHDQWLNLTTMYEDDGKLTRQEVCLVDEKKNECIFCTEIKTYKGLAPSQLGWQPYLIYDPTFNQFTFTVPNFTYLTKTDLANAIYYLVYQEVWCVFNIRINDWSIAEFVTKRHNNYQLDNDDLRMLALYNKENGINE
jgi:hypothetical protein